MLYKRKGSAYWWTKFKFKGRLHQQSTKVTNQREAERIESAIKTNKARLAVGLPSNAPIPLLAQFIDREFLPFIKKSKSIRPRTAESYEHHARILKQSTLGSVPLDVITPKMISAFATSRRKKYAVSTTNRDLSCLSRILKLAHEWDRVAKIPKVKPLPGENRRDWVISQTEEEAYLAACPPLLKDVATLLFDLGLRPEECFRLTAENFRDGFCVIRTGKGKGSARKIPCSERVLEIVARRNQSQWVFPAPTKSGHIDPSSIRKQHAKAIKDSKVPKFVIYSIRHTAITRWSKKVDAYTLQNLAGHRSFVTTGKYVHIDDTRLRGIL